MGTLWGHIMFWDFILLPEEYVKMPAMKAWGSKKRVFVCAVLALPVGVCVLPCLHNWDAVVNCGEDA